MKVNNAIFALCNINTLEQPQRKNYTPRHKVMTCLKELVKMILMKNSSAKFLIFSILISLLINGSFVMSKLEDKITSNSKTHSSKINIIKIRDLGRKDAKDTNDTVQLKDLTLQNNIDLLTKRNIHQKKFSPKKLLNRKKAVQNLELNNKNIVFQSQKTPDFVLNTASQIEFKKGHTIDELNTDELVYHGFRMRTAKQYKNAVIKNINKLKRTNPSLFLKLKNSLHKMKGRISYDIKGNVVSIKTLKWSDSQEIQNFFVSALKDIRAIPNPPEGILSKDGFKATYELQLTL